MTAEMLRSGRALRDRAHVDARIAERAEELARAARHAGHVVADDGYDRTALRHADALDLPSAELDGERALDDGAHLHRRHSSRTAKQIECSELPCEIMHDRDAGLAQRAEQPVGRAGHADHARALEVHERDLVDAADALDGGGARCRRRGDLRARMRRVERVADPQRNAASDGRRHRLRMDDLGAEVRELHRFAVRHLVDDLGFRHLRADRRS